MARWKIDELYIAGYHDVVKSPEHIPCPIPPIYGIIGRPDSFVVPVEDEKDGQVIGREESQEGFAILVEAGEATKIDSYIEAKPSHRLWIVKPEEFIYAPQEEVSRCLEKISDEYLDVVSSILSLQNFFSKEEQELLKQYLWHVVRARPDWMIGHLLLRRFLKGDRARIFETRFHRKFSDKDIVVRQINEAAQEKKSWMTERVQSFIWDGYWIMYSWNACPGCAGTGFEKIVLDENEARWIENCADVEEVKERYVARLVTDGYTLKSFAAFLEKYGLKDNQKAHKLQEEFELRFKR